MTVHIEVTVHESETMVSAGPCQKFFGVLQDLVTLVRYLPTAVGAYAIGYLHDTQQVSCSSQALELSLIHI